MPIGTLLTILGFLLGRARTVSTGDIFLFLCLGLHLTFVGVFALAPSAEVDAITPDLLKIVPYT